MPNLSFDKFGKFIKICQICVLTDLYNSIFDRFCFYGFIFFSEESLTNNLGLKSQNIANSKVKIMQKDYVKFYVKFYTPLQNFQTSKLGFMAQ